MTCTYRVGSSTYEVTTGGVLGTMTVDVAGSVTVTIEVTVGFRVSHTADCVTIDVTTAPG